MESTPHRKAVVDFLEQEAKDLLAGKHKKGYRFREIADLIESLSAQVAELRKLYDELLYAVARKFPGETRHQTALRYINNAETVSVSSGCDAEKESGNAS